MTIILTNCTSRKKGVVESTLSAEFLESGTIEFVSKQWKDNLLNAKTLKEAKATYCGRSFNEVIASSKKLGCPFYIVSAGLGVVNSEQLIPIYNLTVSKGTTNTIQSKLSNSNKTQHWWSVIIHQNPFGKDLIETISNHPNELILIALSKPYIELLTEELNNIPQVFIPNIRFFGKRLDLVLPKNLKNNWIPYDDRLDSVSNKYKGTQTDFAQRALSHFSSEILHADNNGDIEIHKEKIQKILSPLQKQLIPTRKQLSDDEVKTVIENNWEYGQGQSSRLLRIFRSELGFACAQSRFLKIYQVIKTSVENKR